ncbi:NIPSNAP family protein [Micromonospora aurantiaca (nom. illeg.)]|uniref:NIPSNAP family protein n=1 Tax=Micromonospora aurantiaca (nom. illeg.) TaxID=47850 RepID=UPI00161DBEB8
MRRYALRPGHFDDLQRVFQPWFIAGQEHAGMRLGGQFRDRNDPDRFVWFRGFASMDQRREALESFYSGPLWQAHRDAANATMIDSDDVLLLRPTEPDHRPGVSVATGQPGPTVDPTLGGRPGVVAADRRPGSMADHRRAPDPPAGSGRAGGDVAH